MARDIILLIIALAGLVSFFYNPLAGDMKFLQIVLGGIVGYYTGIKEIPLASAFKRG